MNEAPRRRGEYRPTGSRHRIDDGFSRGTPQCTTVEEKIQECLLMDHAAERVVLLDTDRQPCGSAPKTEVHNRNTALHLAFSCYLYKDNGQVLVTRRALSKRTWPGVWTNSCCGHPAPGEAIEDAVECRVHHELGARIDKLTLQIPQYQYRAVDPSGFVENELCPVYSARARSSIRPNRDEVCDWTWVEADDLVTLAGRCAWSLSPWAAEQVTVMGRANLLAQASHAP